PRMPLLSARDDRPGTGGRPSLGGRLAGWPLRTRNGVGTISIRTDSPGIDRTARGTAGLPGPLLLGGPVGCGDGSLVLRPMASLRQSVRDGTRSGAVGVRRRRVHDGSRRHLCTVVRPLGGGRGPDRSGGAGGGSRAGGRRAGRGVVVRPR